MSTEFHSVQSTDYYSMDSKESDIQMKRSRSEGDEQEVGRRLYEDDPILQPAKQMKMQELSEELDRMQRRTEEIQQQSNAIMAELERRDMERRELDRRAEEHRMYLAELERRERERRTLDRRDEEHRMQDFFPAFDPLPNSSNRPETSSTQTRPEIRECLPSLGLSVAVPGMPKTSGLQGPLLTTPGEPIYKSTVQRNTVSESNPVMRPNHLVEPDHVSENQPGRPSIRPAGQLQDITSGNHNATTLVDTVREILGQCVHAMETAIPDNQNVGQSTDPPIVRTERPFLSAGPGYRDATSAVLPDREVHEIHEIPAPDTPLVRTTRSPMHPLTTSAPVPTFDDLLADIAPHQRQPFEDSDLFDPLHPVIRPQGHRVINPKPFSGTPGTWDDYLTYFERLVKVNKWTAEEALDALMLNLEKDANVYIQSVPGYKRLNLVQVCLLLGKRFGAQQTKTRDKAELFNRRKRPNETYEALASDILRLSNRVFSFSSSYAQEEATDVFLRAIPVDLAKAISLTRPTSIEDCVDRLSRYNLVAGAETHNKPSDTVKVFASNVGKTECFNCHQQGHFARDCPKPRRLSTDTSNQGSSPQYFGSTSGDPTCWNCQERGHLMKACIYQRRPLDNYGRRYGPKIPLQNFNIPVKEESRVGSYQRRPDYSRGPTVQFEKRPWGEQPSTANFSGFYSESMPQPNFSGCYGGPSFYDGQTSHFPKSFVENDYLKQATKNIAEELERTKALQPAETKPENQ